MGGWSFHIKVVSCYINPPLNKDSTELSKQGVCQLHYGLAIYIKKYLKAKEELWKFQIFHHVKNIIFKKKNPLKETKILQDIITL
jgi:hypothetical protein